MNTLLWIGSGLRGWRSCQAVVESWGRTLKSGWVIRMFWSNRRNVADRGRQGNRNMSDFVCLSELPETMEHYKKSWNRNSTRRESNNVHCDVGVTSVFFWLLLKIGEADKTAHYMNIKLKKTSNTRSSSRTKNDAFPFLLNSTSPAGGAEIHLLIDGEIKGGTANTRTRTVFSEWVHVCDCSMFFMMDLTDLQRSSSKSHL